MSRSAVLFGILGAVMCVGVGTRLRRGSPEVPSINVLTRLNGPVYVIAVEPVAPESLQAFTEALAQVLPLEVIFSDQWHADERHLLSWEGDLYNADLLIDTLRPMIPRGTRIIGVTDQPMHDEDHWWLYGKARDVCIVSTAHLWRDEWSSDRDWNDQLFRSRLAKVGVHEFGHSAGFQHCEDSRCVMYFATDLWMLDGIEPLFCRKCLEQWLQWNR
jgi:archaemetzincin